MKISSLEIPKSLYLIIGLETILLYLFCKNPLMTSLVTFSLILFLGTIFSVRRLLLTVVFVIIVLPAACYPYSFLPITINNKMLLGFTFLVSLYCILCLLLRGNLKFNKYSLDVPVFLFLGVTFICAINGFLRGNKNEFIVQELFLFSLYGFYFVGTNFIVSDARDRLKICKELVFVIILATLVVAFEYIVNVYISSGTLGYRVWNRQPNIFLLTVPFLIGLLLFDKSRLRKVLYFLILLPIMLAVFFSQTRGVWIALAVQLIVLSFLYRKKIRLRILGIVLVFLILFSTGAVFYIQKFVGRKLLTELLVRVRTLETPLLINSVFHRIIQNRAVFSEVKRHPLIGSGLGAEISYIDPFGERFEQNWIDNAYSVLLWKMGLVGFLIFGWFLIMILRRGFALYRSPPTEFHMVFASSIIALFIGMAVWSLGGAIFVKYRFSIIWALLIGMLEILNEDIVTNT